jgi:large subunit ribosomal protein L9
MYIVLTKDVKDLGYKGDIVQVKRGYFVNYLYPNDLAEFASERAVQKTAQGRKERVLRAEELRKRAAEISQQLATFTLEITMKASSKGKLYGSVDEKRICEALAKQAKVEVLPEQVKMDEHYKQVGDYQVSIQLVPEMPVVLTVKVVAEEKE